MSGGKTQARLSHEEVAERFVDYHFGRLTPAMNRAVEAHVRSCERCKREGLTRAAAERQAANRKLRRVRGGKPLISKRGRIALLALAVLLIGQLVLYQVARGQAQPLLSVFNAPSAPSDAPVALGPALRLPAGASDASAIALSVDAKMLAVAQGGAQPNVSVWATRTGDRVAMFPWPGHDAPATVAWSPDGSMVAASSPSALTVWTVTPVTTVATFALPTAQAMAVFDLRHRATVSTADPAQAFAHGPLAWGADGSLSPAPPGAAGPAGVTTPQTPVVGLWSSEGAHLYGDGHGAVYLGVSVPEAQSGVALLDWAPDGRYLFWAQPNLLVSGVSASSASAAPDPLAQTLVTRIVAQGKGAGKGGAAGAATDALLWFSPDASRVAVCDRTQPNAQMTLYNVATSAPTAILNVACASLPAHAAQWSADSGELVVAPTSGPIAIYTIS